MDEYQKPLPKELTNQQLIDIINGKYYNSDHDFSAFYQTSRFGNGKTDIFINGVTFKTEINIDHTAKCEDFYLRVEGCHFWKKLNFIGCEFHKLTSFSGNKFSGDVHFHGCHFHESMNFAHSTFGRLHVGGGDFKVFQVGTGCSASDISIYGGRFTHSLTFDGALKEVHVYNAETFINILAFSNNLKSTNISIGHLIINNLNLAGWFDPENVINIENLDLHSLRFSSLNNKGKIRINGLRVHSSYKVLSDMTIGEFLSTLSKEEKEWVVAETNGVINESLPIRYLNVTFTNNLVWSKKRKALLKDSVADKESELLFERVYLGDLELKNVDLNSFESIQVIDTDLSTVKTFNSTFPTDKIKGNYHSLYETFNDLYTVAKKKNNKREQIEYYTASKNALLRSFYSEWYKKMPSIVSLWLTKLYSNFGSRWTQSLFVAIPLIAFVFFSSMMLTTQFDIDFSAKGWKTFKELTVYFLQYLNPTHKLDFMDGKIDGIIFSQSAYFVFLDLVGRVFIGIGIYETILSFRKYVRN
ncbi:MAG: pentapeptide repeat-containing protein [Fluviicola sp.]